MTPFALAHYTRIATESDTIFVSIAAGDLRELLDWYRQGYVAADITKPINRVIEWLKRSDWGQYPYMEGSEIYTDKEDALVDLNSAIAALPVPEAPTTQEDAT